MPRHLAVAAALLLAAIPAAGTELVLPLFAHNLPGRNGDVWNSEIYLTNPGDQPVAVEIARFLPGQIERPTPCGQFMSPTRVVPPRSATLWTASGLATDLGCAESARGGLVLRADGPVHITSRIVNSRAGTGGSTATVLSGSGEAVDAVPLASLPGAGTHLLPALAWHRNPCDAPLFDTAVGFANPSSEAVTVTIDIPDEVGRAVLLEGETVFLPHRLEVPPGSWRQLRLAPAPDGGDCGGVESFLLRLELSAPVAVYASVIDRASGDPRAVTPVRIGGE